MAMSEPILIVGAGTTGLTMACELARHGAPVRIIDKVSGISPHCRAASLHARTLEIFYDLGIVDEILAKGNKVLGTSQYAKGVRFMHSSGGELDSPYSFTLTPGAVPNGSGLRATAAQLQPRSRTANRADRDLGGARDHRGNNPARGRP
jgi:2-polyprenyl-6-methoxyphenol hydroxylase-like FAD-dependent oxidoreductase